MERATLRAEKYDTSVPAGRSTSDLVVDLDNHPQRSRHRLQLRFTKRPPPAGDIAITYRVFVNSASAMLAAL